MNDTSVPFTLGGSIMKKKKPEKKKSEQNQIEHEVYICKKYEKHLFGEVINLYDEIVFNFGLG